MGFAETEPRLTLSPGPHASDPTPSAACAPGAATSALGWPRPCGRSRSWLGTERKDDVGDLLRIAPATVRTHLQRVRAKYAAAGRLASTKSALPARALEDGLIGLADLDRPG